MSELREEEKITRLALSHYGIENQKRKAAEEMGELLAAMSKFDDGRATADDVITEIADVEIMMEQLSYYFGEENVEKGSLHD